MADLKIAKSTAFKLLPFLAAFAMFGVIGCDDTAEGMKEDTQQNTEAAKEAGEEAVENTKEATEDISATTLTARIKSAIVANPVLNDPGAVIDVESTGDYVALNGHVISQEQKDEAEQMAKQVLDETGAKQELRNNLEIREEIPDES